MAAVLMEDVHKLSRDLVRDILDLAEYLEAGPADPEHVVCKAEEFIEVLGVISALSNQDVDCRVTANLEEVTIGSPRTTTAGVGQPGDVESGSMDTIYWHCTGEQREGDSAALLETFENGCLFLFKNPIPHAKPPSPPSQSPQLPSASFPAPASTPVPARTLTLTTSTSSTSQQCLITGKKKRGHRKLDLPSVLVEMQAEEEWNRAQHDENIQLLLSEARENEAALQQEMAQKAAFNKAVLGVLGQLVQAVLGQLLQAVGTQ